jgi:hypothetical protein
VTAADVAAAAPLVASTVPASASTARVASLMGRLAWALPRPRPLHALSPLPSPRLLVREAQAPTSRGELVPRRSPPPLPRPTTSTPKSPGKIVPAAHAAGTPHSSILGAPVAESSSPFCAPPAPVAAAALRALGLGAWAGQTVRRSRSPAAGNERKVRPRPLVAREWWERRQKLHSPAGPRGA